MDTTVRKRGRCSSFELPRFDHSSNLFTRWNNLLQEIAERLRSSKGLLQLWQRYKDCYQQCSSTVRKREDQINELLKTATSKDIADDEVTAWIQDCNVCSLNLCTIQQLCELKISTGSTLLNYIFGVLEIFFLLKHLSCAGETASCLLPKSHDYLGLIWSLYYLLLCYIAFIWSNLSGEGG